MFRFLAKARGVSRYTSSLAAGASDDGGAAVAGEDTVAATRPGPSPLQTAFVAFLVADVVTGAGESFDEKPCSSR
jgi:hypothetical protein